MAGDSDYLRLLELMPEQVLSYLSGGFVAIHEWHVAVHQDQVVAAIFLIVLPNVLFHHV